jgi:hypothetical protein
MPPGGLAALDLLEELGQFLDTLGGHTHTFGDLMHSGDGSVDYYGPSQGKHSIAYQYTIRGLILGVSGGSKA